MRMYVMVHGVCFTPQEWNAATSQIRRIVEPVFVQLRWGDKAVAP